MATWSIQAAGESLHGHFDRDQPAVLTIDPGDSVRFEILDAWMVGGSVPGR